MCRATEIAYRVVAVTALMAAAFGCSTHAFAADPHLCNAYALEAFKLAKQVRDDACGFKTTHPQWSMDINAHNRWCRSANVESVDQERHNRRLVASICSGCREYARATMRQIEAAKASGCQTSGGPRWSENEDDHYRWCAGLNHATGISGGDVAIINQAPADETRARSEELGACVAKGPLTVEPAKPEFAKPLSSSRSNTARTIPSETGFKRRAASSSELQSAKRKTKITKDLKSSRTRLTRSVPCTGPHGHPCGSGNRGVLRPGLLGTDGGGFGTQGPAATGTPMGSARGSAPSGGAATLR